MSALAKKISAKDLQAALDKAEETIDVYKAVLLAKNQEVRALQQKVAEMVERYETPK